ncbi:MAG: hypothetical protein WBH45_06540 [Acidobacteriaceae bacterium]
MACTFSGMFRGMRGDGVRFRIDIFGEEVVLFDEPIDLKPMVETVFMAGVMRARVGSFLNVGDMF